MQIAKVWFFASVFSSTLLLQAQDSRSTVLNSVEANSVVGVQRYVEGRLQEHKESFLFIKYKTSQPTYEIVNANGTIMLVDFGRIGSDVHIQKFLNQEVYIQGTVESHIGTPNLVIKALNLRLK